MPAGDWRSPRPMGEGKGEGVWRSCCRGDVGMSPTTLPIRPIDVRHFGQGQLQGLRAVAAVAWAASDRYN